MKQLIIAIIATMFITNIHAQTLSIKIYEITAVNVSNGFTTNVTGKELNEFQVPKNANSVKMSMQITVKDYKKYKLPNDLQLKVTAVGKQQDIHHRYWNPLYKDTVLITECLFPAGDYEITLADQVHPENVFAKRIITVKPNGTNSKNIVTYNGYDYDVSKFKIWVCKSVDEVNWKAIGQTSKISVGSCITFFFDSPDKIKNPGTMRWKLYKVGADGKETFVNQREQTSVKEEWRKMYYEECDEFRTAGKYRIYFAIKNESEAYYGVRDKDYFATADVMVE